jgi:cAMP-dependent protein kinase regulator
MYNAPRAATIICKGDEGKIFALDRITFSQIVKGAAMKKRELYQTVISSVELFKDLNSCEKEQFFDVLKEVKYEAGDYVIKQGEFGSEFYLVIEGNLVAEKLEEGDELPRNVYQYRAGDYFGELSLIHDIGRQASIKALSRVRLASIERDTFKRLLGSLEDILKRNEERYAQMQKTISAA